MESRENRAYDSLRDRYAALMCTVSEIRAIRSELDATDEVRRRVALHAQYSKALKTWREAFQRFTTAVRTVPVPRWTGQYKKAMAAKRKRAVRKTSAGAVRTRKR